jgi:hypothetical protein
MARTLRTTSTSSLVLLLVLDRRCCLVRWTLTVIDPFNFFLLTTLESTLKDEVHHTRVSF